MPKRRHAKCNQDESETPVAESVLDFLDRIGAETSCYFEGIGEHQCHRDKAERKNQRLPDETNLADSIHRNARPRFGDFRNFGEGLTPHRGEPHARRSR